MKITVTIITLLLLTSCTQEQPKAYVEQRTRLGYPFYTHTTLYYGETELRRWHDDSTLNDTIADYRKREAQSIADQINADLKIEH